MELAKPGEKCPSCCAGTEHQEIHSASGCAFALSIELCNCFLPILFGVAQDALFLFFRFELFSADHDSLSRKILAALSA